MTTKTKPLTNLQRRMLARVLAFTLKDQWCRAESSGERVTLASLHAKGLLKRRVWRESAKAKVEGRYGSPAHEYQVEQIVLDTWKEAQKPRLYMRSRDPQITVADVAKAYGRDPEDWKGWCFAVATAIVEAGLVKGQPVYGHWLGQVAPGSMFAGKASVGFARHGWVLLDDGRVLDPTRWVFEDVPPYIYVGPAGKEYDEGGNQLRSRLTPPQPPSFDPDARTVTFTDKRLATDPFCFVEQLLKIDLSVQEPGVFTVDQVHWIANQPLATLGKHAPAIYAAIEAVGMGARIPIDNRRAAQRMDASP